MLFAMHRGVPHFGGAAPGLGNAEKKYDHLSDSASENPINLMTAAFLQ
jgi:hypothetical protein